MASSHPAHDAPFSLEDRRPGPVVQLLTNLFVRRLIPAFFSLLRKVAPVIRFPTTNTVIVTRFDDVQEICLRNKDFPVPYQRMVDHLDWDPTFLLAMKDTPAYHETLKQVRQLWRSSDLEHVRQIAREVSESVLDLNKGRIDAIQGLMVPVTLAVIHRYYGVAVPDHLRQPFIDGCLHTAGFLFGPQTLNPKKIATAKQAVAGVWKVIDLAIAEARKNPLPDNTIIGRCHALDITDDHHLRSYLMGMIMGYLPTNTLANGHALDVIMNNPLARQYGSQAAKNEDYPLILGVVYEALRMSYILPGLWRTAPEKQELGIGNPKQYSIDKGRLLYISYMSAMQDPRRIENPKAFNPYRSKDVYLIYGYHFHYCVGAAIADSMMEEIFMVIMRRSPKQIGRLRFNGDFPWNLILEYDQAQP